MGFSMRFPILLLAWSCSVASAQQQSSWEQIGDIRVNRTHAAWTSPESLVGDLRSQDQAVRLQALRLVGAEALFAEVGPDEIELRYASLGGGRTKQAILLVETASYAYAAVAVPSLNTWERIAVFECWCKYEDPTLLLILSASSTHITAFQT
jgi:hypothetical protein